MYPALGAGSTLVFGECCIQLLLCKIGIYRKQGFQTCGGGGGGGKATLPIPEPRLDSYTHSRTDIFYQNTQNGFYKEQLNKSV